MNSLKIECRRWESTAKPWGGPMFRGHIVEDEVWNRSRNTKESRPKTRACEVLECTRAVSQEKEIDSVS